MAGGSRGRKASANRGGMTAGNCGTSGVTVSRREGGRSGGGGPSRNRNGGGGRSGVCKTSVGHGLKKVMGRADSIVIRIMAKT